MSAIWAIEEARTELRRLLSLAGNNGDWQSGVKNIWGILAYYFTEDVANRQEFERLILDANELLQPTETN